MKRIVAICFALLIISSMGSITLAEMVEDSTEFEQILLAKGTLIKKEFIDITTFIDNPTASTYNQEKIQAQAAILTEMTSNTITYALRLQHSYYNSKYDSGTSTEVLDLPELDSVISTLKCLKEEFKGNLNDYTEYNYTSNSGLKIGAYHSRSEGNKLFIRFNSSDIVRMSFDRIDALIDFFEKAKSTIESYQ